MNRGTLVSALFVIALITLDFTFTVAHARNTVNVYKVTKVKKSNALRMRRWPGPKSHVKASLPFNAKNITATGKKKVVGKTKWIEIKWKNNQGWVNGNYLKKTGALIVSKDKSGKSHSSKSRNTASKQRLRNPVSSRNSRSTTPKSESRKRIIESPMEIPPNEFGGDRYDQTIETDAHEVRISYIPKNMPKKKQNKKLSCSGNIPKPWNMKLNISGNRMKINFPGKKSLNVPLRYNEWTSPNKSIMSLGGSRGRNLVVDVNLERSNACRSGYSYEINTTINNQFYSGCCR